MSKRKSPGGRKGLTMANTLKSMNSNASDDHQGKEEILQKHAEAQRLGHENRVRAEKGLPLNEPTMPPLDGQNEEDAKNPEEFVMPYDPDSDLLGIDRGHLIVARRIYKRDKDFLPEGMTVDGDQYVAHHRKIRRDRKTYRDTSRAMVTVGAVTGERKGAYMDDPKNPRFDKFRKAPGVMQSMIVRLMPHEAIIAGPLLTQKALDEAVDKTVRAVVQALGEEEKTHGLGCEVLSAVVHRMGNNDLHIHIQFTMVVDGVESPTKLGQTLAPWKEKAAAMAREVLKAEGNENPAPRTIDAMKKKLIASGDLEPKPVAKQEFRKFAGKRSLGKGHILNYTFRQKLNLVRAAEEGGRPDLAQAVTDKHDERGGFRRYAYPTKVDQAEFERKLKMKAYTEEDAFLDLWLERTWRNAVKAQLPAEVVQEMVKAGVAAAADYAMYGTVMIEQTHIDRLKKEQDLRQSALDAQTEAQEKNAEALRSGIEAERSKVAAELALAESARIRAEDVAAPIVAAARLEAAGIAKDAELRGLEQVLGKMIPGRKSKAENVEEAEKALDDGIAEIRERAEVGAWARVLKFLGKGDDVRNATPESLAKAAEKAIVGRISDMVAGIFRSFGREAPVVASTPEVINAALTAAGEGYKADARREGLALAVAKIRGVEASEVCGLDEAGLTEEIEKAAGNFRDTMENPEKVAVRGLAEHVFGGSLTKFLIKGVKKSIVGMKDLLKQEFDRRGAAEAHLEKALPLLEKHDAKLAESARKVIAARPQVPVPAKKAARAEKPAGGGEPDTGKL